MSNASSQNRRKILFLVQFSLLTAIEAIVCFTPLGSLPALGPIVATLSHIPVVLTAVLLGTAAGAAMGFMFGLFSFIVWTFTPPPLSAAIAFVFTPFYSLGEIQGNFWSLVICFLPRILIGVVTGLCFSLLKKVLANRKNMNALIYAASGFLGSLTNTLLVLGGIYIFFGKQYATAIGTEYALLLGMIGTTILASGIPEAVLGAVFSCVVGGPVKRIIEKQR